MEFRRAKIKYTFPGIILVILIVANIVSANIIRNMLLFSIINTFFPPLILISIIWAYYMRTWVLYRFSRQSEGGVLQKEKIARVDRRGSHYNLLDLQKRVKYSLTIKSSFAYGEANTASFHLIVPNQMSGGLVSSYKINVTDETRRTITAHGQSDSLFVTNYSFAIDHKIPNAKLSTYQSDMEVNNHEDVELAFFVSTMIIFRFQAVRTEYKYESV